MQYRYEHNETSPCGCDCGCPKSLAEKANRGRSYATYSISQWHPAYGPCHVATFGREVTPATLWNVAAGFAESGTVEVRPVL